VEQVTEVRMADGGTSSFAEGPTSLRRAETDPRRTLHGTSYGATKPARWIRLYVRLLAGPSADKLCMDQDVTLGLSRVIRDV
jgi:hypothetical protein